MLKKNKTTTTSTTKTSKGNAKYSRDWFGRRAENDFTDQDHTNKFFNWDRGRSSYSSYFVKSGQSLEIASRMVNSIFRVIGVKKGVKQVARVPKDSHAVQVPIGMLKDESGSYKDRDNVNLDAFYGASIQNAAFKALQTNNEYYHTLQCLDTTKKSFRVNDLLYSVLNTERINKKLSTLTPGYLRFVQKYKNQTFEKSYTPLDEFESPHTRFLDLLVRMLRYPTEITEKELEEFQEPLDYVKKELLSKTNGVPSTTADCKRLSKEMSEYIYSYFELPPKDQSGGGGSGDEDGEENGDGDGDQEEEEESNSSSSKYTRKELNQFAKKLSKQIFKSAEGTASEEKALEDMQKEASENNDFKYNADDENNNDENIRFIHVKEDLHSKAMYKNDLSKINMVKAAVLRKLFERESKDYRLSLKGMRSGYLDTCKLAEAVQGVPTIYERSAHVKTNKLCVGILIDESGSMSGRNIEKARQAAVFINEVFKNSTDIELLIYGHTADQRDSKTNIYVYKEPGHSNQKFALGAVTAKSNNRDGAAILGTARRIRKFTDNPGILLVLSDGAPHASGYGGNPAIEDTRIKVLKAEKLGLQVIQIAIENHVPSDRMFSKFVKMTDIKSLPSDLTVYLSSKISRMIKTKTTY